jgi:hypothetical protein
MPGACAACAFAADQVLLNAWRTEQLPETSKRNLKRKTRRMAWAGRGLLGSFEGVPLRGNGTATKYTIRRNGGRLGLLPPRAV